MKRVRCGGTRYELFFIIFLEHSVQSFIGKEGLHRSLVKSPGLVPTILVVVGVSGRRGDPNPRGDTSARPQPRKNYWAPVHERRVLPDHQLQLPPSKAPNPSTLLCPSTQLSHPNPNPNPTPSPPPNDVAGRRLLRRARRRGLPVGASLVPVQPDLSLYLLMNPERYWLRPNSLILLLLTCYEWWLLRRWRGRRRWGWPRTSTARCSASRSAAH